MNRTFRELGAANEVRFSITGTNRRQFEHGTVPAFQDLWYEPQGSPFGRRRAFATDGGPNRNSGAPSDSGPDWVAVYNPTGVLPWRRRSFRRRARSFCPREF